MTKYQKKQLTAVVLFFIALAQIFNFAVRYKYISIFPSLTLDFAKKGIFGVIAADLNWPFKLLNFYVYKLFGWVGLVSPLFLFAFGSTLFVERETKKVKRKRVILLWGLAEVALFIYVASSISFIIMPGGVAPGIIVKLFARYLKNVGGSAFLTLFFLYTLISYYLFIKKSNWHDFIKNNTTKVLSVIVSGFYLLAYAFDKRKRNKKLIKSDNRPSRIENKPAKRLTDKKSVKSKDKSDMSDDVEKTNSSGSKTREVKELDKDLGELDNKEKEKIIDDVDFQTSSIDEFDSTDKSFQFNFDALNENKTNDVNDDYVKGFSDKIINHFNSTGIKLNQSGLTVGPRLLRFEYDFPSGIQLKEIEKQQEELSYRLGGVEVDIEMPIPGTDKFGVYIERDNPDVLGLGSYIKEIKDRKEHIPIFVGVAADGRSVWTDGADLPHLLIAGTTGSGKSVFLNNIILNLIAVSEMNPLNIILVDPKHVEFAPYRDMEQLASPIITDTEKAMETLVDAEKLMDERYKKITGSSVRNIFEYNEENKEKMPFIFIIIDEFSDMIMQDKTGQIKSSIIRLAQKARAVGIHLVLATQRPSSDVIDGLIKANFPARVSFKTSSKVDSRIIIDENGAENLLGKGDMIIKTNSNGRQRLQAIYVGIGEIKNIVNK